MKTKRYSWLAVSAFVFTGTIVCGTVRAIDYSGINQYKGRLREMYGGARAPSNSEGRSRNAPAVELPDETEQDTMAQQKRDDPTRVSARDASLSAFNIQAGAALDRRDYRQALEALNEMLAVYRQWGFSSYELQKAIKRANALATWSEATTSDEKLKAISIMPELFDKYDAALVEQLDRNEQNELKQPRLKAAAESAKSKMRLVLSNLIAATTKPAPLAKDVLDDSGNTSPNGGFGTSKARPNTAADNEKNREHAAVEHGFGFDSFGPIKGEVPSPPAEPTSSLMATKPLVIPDRLLNNREFLQNPEYVKLRECEAKVKEAKRDSDVAASRMETERAKDPNSSALFLLESKAKQTRDSSDEAVLNASIQAKTVLQEMVTFKGF